MVMMQAEMMNGVSDKTGVRAEVNNTQIFGVVATGTIKDFMINGVIIGNITVKTNNSGKWDEIKVIAYTIKDNLEKVLKLMLDRAKQTYQEAVQSAIICTKRVNIIQISGHCYLNQCYLVLQLIKKMSG
ncbi:hypothetical protein [Campylobacter devanensis]|uniref:hypothetical protein n=1 Tax=Campylobacter devanensis TaxID=3161138 RepID=UPI00112FB094|nr:MULTISPECIES: hypothetical protein [unclassified Campylobacter]